MRHLGFGEARDRGAFPHRGHLGFFEVNFGTVSMVGRERNSKLPSPLKVCVCVCVCVGGRGWSAGEGNGNPLQYSCLGNPMERGVWQATVYGEREGDQMNEKVPRGPQLSLAEKI